MSNLRLVIKASDIRGRLFQIVTGYPELSLDETDVVYDAMEEWTASRKGEDT